MTDTPRARVVFADSFHDVSTVRSYEYQRTAMLCGIDPLPPTPIINIRRCDPLTLSEFVVLIVRLHRSYSTTTTIPANTLLFIALH
jgi:hypothetical protein